MKTNLLLTILSLCLLRSAYTDRHPTQKTVATDAPESSNKPLFIFRPEGITVVKIIDPQHCLLILNSPGQLRAEATAQFLAALAQTGSYGGSPLLLETCPFMA